jgi:hypothetical protein
MDKQAVFNKVAEHLLTQNVRCIGVDNRCAYRDPDTGRRCAIGCLIPDELYKEEMEGWGITDLLITNSPLSKALDVVTEEDWDFLAGLQNIHDRGMVSEWRDCLWKYAEDNGLKFDFPEKE